MKKLAVAAAVLALACAPEKPAAPPQPAAAIPELAGFPAGPPNLLEMTRGAAVVSRTGEVFLGASPVRAIDTDPMTVWVNPPQNVKQTLVFSLPARARIDQIGMTTALKPPNEVRTAQFELSEDGEHYTDAGIHEFKAGPAPQLFKISPATARFVRITTLTGVADYVQIATAYAVGELLDKVQQPSIAGTWIINGESVTLSQVGSHVSGLGPSNTTLEGGTDGKLFRFTWTRPNKEYGLAAITITPDGKHLGGMVWHEEAIQAPQFWADDWLGDRAGEAPAPHLAHTTFQEYLQRFGYFPLYGLRFDDQGRLDEAESASMLDEITPAIKPGSRFVAHELIRDSALCKTELDTLRAALQKRGVNLTGVDFVAMGDREPRRPGNVDLVRAMYSTVELQIRR